VATRTLPFYITRESNPRGDSSYPNRKPDQQRHIQQFHQRHPIDWSLGRRSQRRCRSLHWL